MRSNDWQMGVSVQQQVLPRVSVEIGYFRRWLNNFTITDNLAVGSDRLHRSTASPRRPIRGCRAAAATRSTGSTTSSQAKFGQTSNNITLADDIGDQYQHYNGMLFNVSARLGSGVQFQGGINTGKTVQDNCAVRAQVPELTTAAGVSPAVNVGNPYCHSDPGFITKATALGSYTMPKVDVLVSGTLRSDQGAPARGQLERARWRVGLGGTRPAGGGGRHHGADQPGGARRGVGRSRQRARPALRQDPALRPRRATTSGSTSSTRRTPTRS